MFISPVSGVYADDQILAAEPVQPQVRLRYSFRDSAGAEGPWIPFRGPLALTAAPGEQREYRVIIKADSETGELARRELSFRIDKRTPAAPRVLPEPGTYWDTIAVRFEAAPGSTVFYSIQGDIVRTPIQWNGTDIGIGENDRKAVYVVQAYATDAAGNRSRIVTARYALDTRAPILDVLSPVPGTFANPQALALSFRDMLWVRYTDDGSDPATAGSAYTGPVTLPRQGSTTIRIAGQPRAARRPIQRREVTVTYAPARGTGLLLDTDNGTYPRGISPRILSSPDGSVYYSLWDKTPTESDLLATSGIAVSASTGGPSPVVLRLRTLAPSGDWGPEYRYFYYVGQGAVTPPAVNLNEPEPIRSEARAQVTAPEDALLSVTVDGSQPSARSPAPTSWFSIAPGAGSAPVVVRALAFDGSGLQSALAERRIQTAAVQGSAAAFAFAAGPTAGTAVLSAPPPAKGALAYELTSDGSDPGTPGSDSPRLSGPVTLSIPFGMLRTFKVKMAVLDESGRFLSVSAAASVTLNRKPPDRPSLSPLPGATLDEATALKIESPAKIFFSLSSDGTTPGDPDPVSSPSSTFLALPGVDGTVITYRLKLAAIDDAKNATEVYGPLLYTVDLRPPRIPTVSMPADAGRYNARHVSPVMGESAWNVRYTATSDGTEPPDPDQASELLTGASVFGGEDGAVTTWHVKLLAISHNGKRVGERREISFVIDLSPPDVPKLTGLPPGGRVARPVVLIPEALAADAHLFYSVSTGGADPADPVTAGGPFPAALTLDVPEGVRRDYEVRIAARDDAGNRSLYDRRYRFTIDRELPDDPQVQGASEGVISARPVSLTLESREAVTVYEMTDDGTMPRLPTPGSTAYSGPLLLVGRPGASVTYRILARSFNDLGTASRAARIFSLTIDRTVPVPPLPPSVQYSIENPGVALLSWPQPGSGRILFRLTGTAAPAEPAEFAPFDAPVSIAVNPGSGSTITGEAVAESPAGVRSAPVAFSVPVGRQLPPPVFRGAHDGTVATQKIELRTSAATGQVRYEVSTDGSYPPTVTALSPVFPDPLVLDAADGQTVSVRVSARAFDPTGASAPSDEVSLKATIDRTPPDPPVATGIEDGGYYQDTKLVPLLSAEGTIYYTVSTNPDPLIPSQTDANKYSGALSLNAQPGQSVTYHVVAFSVDAAGNRSREIRAWTVTIDQKVVYAAPTGNDYADGSRSAPVRSLGRALQIASTTARRTIFAAAGDYPLDSQLGIDADVALVGGLDADSWQPLGLERWSTLRSVSPWRTGSSLVSISGGKVSIRGFELASGAAPLPALLSVSGGTIAMQQASMRLKGPAAAQGISMSGGVVSLIDVRMQADGTVSGSFVSVTGGSLNASGSRFSGPNDTNDFAAIDMKNARGELKGVTIDPGAGQRTRGIRAAQSSVSVSGSRIESGSGTIEAAAIDVRDGTELSVENSDIAAVPSARSPSGILASASTVTVTRSRITIGGTASAVGVSARGGDLVLLRTSVKAAATREYQALVRLEEARALIADNLLVGGAAGQSVGVQMKGGAADIVNNTLVAGTGSPTTAGILVQGDRLPRLVNNIITRSGDDRGTAISIIEARAVPAAGSPLSSMVVLSNTFGGWQRLLRIDHVPGLGLQPMDAATLSVLNSADGDGFGGPISGNRSEQAGATFAGAQTGVYTLARGSACLDAGTDLAAAGGPGGTGALLLRKVSEISSDLLGNPRPAAVQLQVPGPPRGWDIGAYEYAE